MNTKDKILVLAKKQGRITAAGILRQFDFSRQYLGRILKELVDAGQLVKVGTTRSAFYASPDFLKKNRIVLPNHFSKTFKNIGLEEHKVLDQIETALPLLRKLPDNIHSIFTYAFSEMLNNAIEHSQSKTIKVEVLIENQELFFSIADSGIGVFRNIQQKRKLENELAAIQDLLKGKTTTMPKSHSGEGIFFTSKVASLFILNSFGYKLHINNKVDDIFVSKTNRLNKGTLVTFRLSGKSKLHLNDVFKKYTNLSNKGDFGFDKTEIQVKLYTISGVHISRSQARRVLAGLEKFKVVLFDFDKVPMVGQAFADEIFRVFHEKNPQIRLETTNMNEAVEFMVKRAKRLH
ncbi:MAG: DUF4325 domain-containing protein [Candidatus Peribacteraceae bacterium]|nr:DUF4325 domain-containing protein [Candidatus Peribacteraceae bacterium]